MKKDYDLICQVCNSHFIGHRKTGMKYCSPKCALEARYRLRDEGITAKETLRRKTKELLSPLFFD